MSEQTELTIRDGVALIALGHPPNPVLSAKVLARLDELLDRFAGDDELRAVALFGNGRAFPAGTEDDALHPPRGAPTLGGLCRRIEAFAKPVVAALHGAVIGGGAELALAAHYRVAHRAARIGFPNVRLGMVPSAGATQRLPRLAGAELALDLLLSGRLTPLSEGKAAILLDEVFDEDEVSEAALAAARDLLSRGAKPRPAAAIRAGFSDAVGYQRVVDARREALRKTHEVAPRKILGAVEAALLLPIEAGLEFEAAAAEDCAATDQARALRHAFHAEQAAAANTRRRDLPEIDTIAVLGGGPVAVQIVICALDAGLRVRWGARQSERLRDGVARVRGTIQQAVTRGVLGEEKAAQCLDALSTGDSADMVETADMVLRAARGQRGVPVPAGIPAAQSIAGEENRLAIRFAPPASTTRLAEIVIGPAASEDDRLAALALARRLGKVAVVEHATRDCVLDRLIAALFRAGDALIDRGQSPYRIDAALRAWGMAHPPYELADLAGMERVSRHERGPGAQNWSGTMLRLGRAGRTAGQGFYLYEDDGEPQIDPVVVARLDERRKPSQPLPPERIARCVIGALTNEGARCLREGMAMRATDLDVVSVLSGLVPRWRGGVMHAAGLGGLLRTAREMEALGHPDTAFWTPEPVFGELIKNGRVFDDL